MALRYLLDTNTVSYVAAGKSQAAQKRLASLEDSEMICISAVTEAELLFGLARRPDAHRLRHNVQLLLSEMEVLPWRHEEALSYSRLRMDLESRGQSLSPLDTLIAAHALALPAILVTSDKAFGRVANLPIENWATDL